MPGEGYLPPFSATPATQNASFYSIQMNRSPISQLAQNKPFHFSCSPHMNVFLTPPALQCTQNKSLHCKTVRFFYSLQMNGHESLLTNH
jgi:hypothetical protein